MPTAKRRRTSWAIAVSALAHGAVLIAALLQRPALPPPLEPDAARQTLIPLLLATRMAHASGKASLEQAREASRRRSPERVRSAQPSPAQPSTATLRPAAGPPHPSEPAPSTIAGASSPLGPTAPDLRLALSHGVVGCANADAMGTTRAERERCDDQLAARAATAPVLGIALSPRIRRYYDAVALAKTRDPPAVLPVMNRAPIRGDPPPQRPGADHIPLIGCVIPFGVGEKPKLPEHWLKLGPCFIAPPKGPFTEEVDITPP